MKALSVAGRILKAKLVIQEHGPTFLRIPRAIFDALNAPAYEPLIAVCKKGHIHVCETREEMDKGLRECGGEWRVW